MTEKLLLCTLKPILGFLSSFQVLYSDLTFRTIFLNKSKYFYTRSMRELKWIIDGFIGVIISILLTWFLWTYYIALQQTIPTAGISFTFNWNFIAWLLEISGWFYIIYVAEKRTWITKEIFVSLGMILAGMVLDSSSLIIGFLAIIVILFRKILSLLS